MNTVARVLFITQKTPDHHKDTLDLLNLEGYSVELITLGEKDQIIETAISLHPDLILLSVEHYKHINPEFIHELRQPFQLAVVPLILLSTSIPHSSIMALIKAGVDAYLFYPFSDESFLELLEGQLARRMRHQKSLHASLTAIRQSVMTVLPHQLRTQLASAMGLASVIRDSADDVQRTRLRELAARVIGATQELEQLFKRHLLYAELRLEELERHPDMGMVCTPVSQSSLESVLLYKGRANYAHVRLDIHDAIVKFSWHDLVQVLLELIDLALSIWADYGALLYGRIENNQYILLLQRDAEELLLNNHFLPVSGQIHQSADMSTLNLAICDLLARRHHGQVAVVGRMDKPAAVQITFQVQT